VKWAPRGIAIIVAGLAGVSPAAADPTTFGYGNARLGSDPPVNGITPANIQQLRPRWRTSLGGAINTQPLVVDGVSAGGRTRNLVLVGTEHGLVVALDADSGAIVWRRQVGSRKLTPVVNCAAGLDNRYGITATLTIDRAAGRVYAVDVNGLAWALSLASGRTIGGWPVRVHAQGDQFVWGGLTLSRGRLYIGIASRCDAGSYAGGVTAVDVNRPSIVRRWLTTAGSGESGGGVWGWGGVSVDDRTGDVFAATGNSIGRNEAAGAAESVVRLSSTLAVKQVNNPLRGPFRVSDRDFGTTPVLLNAGGCPPQLVAMNKDGEVFLYNRNAINAGPVQRLRVADPAPSQTPLIGVPSFDPATRTLVLVSPSAPPHSQLRAGLQAFRLSSGCRLVLRWQSLFDGPYIGSPATIAGGLVFIGSGEDGWLRVYRLSDGFGLWSGNLFGQPIFAAPSVARATVFTGDWSGRVTAFGLGH
jgi:outer membrane protein assembly factor BamB